MSLKWIYLLLTVVIAILLLVFANTIIPVNLKIHSNNFINTLAKYQIFALIVSVLVVLCVLKLNTESKQFLRLGNINNIALRETWLGINGKSSWRINAIQLLFFVSVGTGVFMFFALKYSGSVQYFQWRFLPFIILFSLSNSLAEELIFRFGIIGILTNHSTKLTILLTSSILFGLPHYFGSPSGFIGVLMAGVLGYILGKATLETKGLAIAWAIHFVQDVIIFTALFMMNVRP
jgi:uncharacterized protein